ncbi:prolyl oligopeptidase family serine peptidase [Piscinibacter sp.]|uniref:S9 family peptidase n=1 Tax=Piscinibacter sp. TaxID=1903157 RepID=UPI0039E28E19
MLNRCLTAGLLAGLTAVLLPAAQAQTVVKDYKSAAEVPVAQFFALEDFRSMRLSPDGKNVAAVAPYKGRGNLLVVDLAGRQAKSITASERWDVVQVRWIGNKRLYFTVADGLEASGRPRLKGAYTINVDGTDMKEVFGYNDNGAPRGLRIVSVLDTEGGDSTVAYVAMRERSREYADVYKLDFRNLRFELLSFDSPGRTGQWELDSQRRPRIAVRHEPRPAQGKPVVETFWHKPASGGAWEKLFEYNLYVDPETYSICGFDKDDKTLYVTARRGRDKSALWKYDTQTKQFGDMVLDDPLVDLECNSGSDESEGSGSDGGLLTDPKTKEVVGFQYQGDRPKKVYFTPGSEHERLAKMFSAAVPGFSEFRFSKDRSVALVMAYSDIDPGTYYLYDAAKKQLEVVARKRAWVKPELMAERKPILYKSRDGLTIPAYLTLPRGMPAKNLPLIVNIHGGPQVRGYYWSEWGRWPEAQFFASHGYAVLEPEPRLSMGFGHKLYSVGFKQWGQAAQDDITDGALHLVKEGIVDKERMCLHGGSYGGYASLQGLVREPNLFKCAHSFVAVTDLGLMQSVAWSDIAEDVKFDYLANEFKILVGDSKDDAEMFQRVSPARNADKIKGAVMLTMGSDDVRVPLIHGEKMRDAMIKAGKPIEWKVYAEEAHGFNKEANVTDFYTRSLRFYDEHIGAKRKTTP